MSATVYPNLAIRYGISKRLEINTELSFLSATGKTSFKQTATGFEPVMPGINYLLLDETANAPAIILTAQAALPFLASKNFTASYLAPTLQANFQKTIKKWGLGISAGAFWDGFNPKASFIYNATVAYNCTDKWVVSSELFGFINSGTPQHNMDINLAYQKSKYFQLRCTGGIGLSSAAHKSYFAINGSRAFSLKRKQGA
ncbi:MAG: transporter [Chitinophagaceae bacterium]|nr:transporter [Chitinophagaceae bacterium]